MAINYPVDVQNTKWTVYDTDTSSILPPIHREWPVLDGSEIPGQEANIVYLLETSGATLNVDRRLYSITTNINTDVAANIIHTSFTAVKRPVDEIITAIENEESSQLAKIVDLVQEAKETRLMLGALLFYDTDAQAFTPKAQAMLDDYKVKALKLWKNRDRSDALKDDAANDRDVLIDEGWEAP